MVVVVEVEVVVMMAVVVMPVMGTSRERQQESTGIKKRREKSLRGQKRDND